MHRTILVVDVEGYGDKRRTNTHQIAVREGLYRVLEQAFSRAEIPWSDCDREDGGDAVLVLAPAQVPKEPFVDALPLAVIEALVKHNETHAEQEQIRLRMAVHAGEVNYDDHGFAGASIILAFRLLDSRQVREALAASPGVLALIVSPWFFDEVVRHSEASDPASYRRVQVAVKETVTPAWIYLPEQPHPARPARASSTLSVPRQLPASAWHFTGRVPELAMLTTLLSETTNTGGTVIISAIDGTAGIGKTALAVFWAHQVAHRFPDGQLYVNLRGFDPSGAAMTPAEAVRDFLAAFEVPPAQIPVSMLAQVALYRSLLAGKRVLVVLDNARDTDQVRPLLPGSAGCFVLVTSRNQLTSLITLEGARPLTVDVLTEAEAKEFVARRVGSDRVAAEPHAVDEIIDRCARLPLAVSVVAARAATHPGFSLAALADELRDIRGGLAAFDDGDLSTDVRTVFSWSYRRLNTDAATMFRFLGLHPGPDISLPAAASLAGTSPRRVRSTLTELARANLVREHVPGRFAFHDLLRAYATEQGRAQDSEATRREAIHRVLDHYLHTAYTAARLIYPRRGLISLAPPISGVTPERLTDFRAAWTWFETEYPVLLAASHLANVTGHDAHSWQLPWTLEEFANRHCYWHDWAAIEDTALVSAERRNDRYAQAHVHRGVARAHLWFGRVDQAHAHFQQAFHLFQEAGDQTGLVDAHIELSWMFERLDRHEQALTHAEQALTLSRGCGYDAGQARALNNIGWYHTLLGNHAKALTLCQESLAIRRRLDDRFGEGNSLDSLGYAHHQLGNYQQAITNYEEALTAKQEIGDHYREAVTLVHLGDTYHATGNLSAARERWERALELLDGLIIVIRPSRGYPNAAEIRAKLNQLGQEQRIPTTAAGPPKTLLASDADTGL